MGSEEILNLLLATCKKTEKEQQPEIRKVLEESFEVEENKTFTWSAFHSDNLKLKA